MVWARASTFTESIWNMPSRAASAVICRRPGVSGRAAPKPWAARAMRRACDAESWSGRAMNGDSLPELHRYIRALESRPPCRWASVSAEPENEAFDRIHALPLWRGRIDIAPLSGGITNRNYLVRDGGRRVVARLGGDIPVHGVMRFNEHAASRAAAAAGISPAVRHAEPGLLVLDYVEGGSLTPEQVRADRDRCVALVRAAHMQVGRHLRGPALAFNVFHILSDYAHTLRERSCRHAAALPGFAAAAAALQSALGPIELVFAHNDLLAGNIIDDGSRLWLIDWDYAGFNTPLFDLGGLASNNFFTTADEAAMLELYFGTAPDAGLRRRFAAITCASLLREAMWSMVSELHSDIDFDYVAYTDANLANFRAAYVAFRDQHA